MNKTLGIIVAMLLVLMTFSLDSTPPLVTQLNERPIVNLPVSLRQINWLGPQAEGSCGWASLVMGLNWEGEYEKAKKVRASRGDGVTPQGLLTGLTQEGIPYAATLGRNDVEFLEQAIAGRRGVLVAIDEGDPTDNECHMVLLTHLDNRSACFIDNNNPRADRWMTRNEFLAEWEQTGSWAVCPLFSPCPPLSHAN